MRTAAPPFVYEYYDEIFRKYRFLYNVSKNLSCLTHDLSHENASAAFFKFCERYAEVGNEWCILPCGYAYYFRTRLYTHNILWYTKNKNTRTHRKDEEDNDQHRRIQKE